MDSTFAKELSRLMEEYRISSAALSRASGLSAPVISRLKTGKREPAGNSDLFYELCQALAKLSGTDLETIRNRLFPVLKDPGLDEDSTINNLNYLIRFLDLNVNDLSRYLNFDPSYLSRIRQKKRHPANLREMITNTSQFIAGNCTEEKMERLSALLQKDLVSLEEENAAGLIFEWLTSGGLFSKVDGISSFLSHLDRFDLNEFLRTLPVDDSSQPALIPSASHAYYHVDGFKQAELDWLHTVNACGQSGDIILYSDMPMEKMSADPVFVREWIAGMSGMVKRGNRLHMIHYVDRNFSEMMLGLESYIPLYMTGQFHPYYFREMKDPVFHHFIRSAPTASLCGEAIAGCHDHGRYYFSVQKEEVQYQKQRAMDMLEKATVLMDIYNAERCNEYQQFLSNFLEPKAEGFRSILASPMLYTMPDDLLETILSENDLDEQEKDQIRTYLKLQKDFFNEQLKYGLIQDEAGLLDEESFQKYPVCLPLSDLFREKSVPYTYEQYQRHLEASRQAARENPRYEFIEQPNPPFSNIQIRIIPGKKALVSRNTSPSIHFVITQPKLLRALENMTIHIRE